MTVRKTVSVLLIAVLVSSVALVGSVRFGTVQATGVTGIISSDTTWTKAGSPYDLTGKVLVNNGVTLKIEPGVIVNLNSYYIRVDGTLSARGTSSDKIYINGGDHITDESGIFFRSACTSWNEQTGSGCIIENANFSCPVGVSNTVKITNTDGAYFSISGGSALLTNNSNCGFEVMQGSPTISNNNIVSGIAVYYASPLISNNKITGPHNNGDGIFLNGDAYDASILISDNIIVGSFPGACIDCGVDSVGKVTILRNLLLNDATESVGIYVGGEPTLTIQGNTIGDSCYGIKIGGAGFNSDISYNNFLNSSQYTIYLISSQDLTAINNWWGTTDTAAINQSIYDVKNDYELGKVTFIPFLTAPNSEAPTNPTPTQPSNSSGSNSQNSTSTPNQSSNQNNPETNLTLIAVAAIVFITAIALFAFGMVLLHRKNR